MENGAGTQSGVVISAESTSTKKYMPAWFVGLFQAVGAFVYLGLVSVFSAKSQALLAAHLDERTGTILYFSILLISTLAFGLIFLSYPLYLHQRGMSRRALSSLGYTFLWLLLIVALFIAIVARTPVVAPQGMY